ncbi:flagellar hook-associated protein 1 [Alicyclobacillus cellulosilyticus]|uniref:Flagellar hook-associated protein 1 n=1 Tax=Alicyclobacillus cellulosilyticus TaxID=1003997 RepID=A0A917KH15_9BACL|nr:flagellar hook-associated protein FlgK [Alicyclobacillus cellulosilyticus]GGJ11414.1 flagellar hook-associated protein 1 [Alicyclobacillus cellulosilyticus]
MPSTFLPLQIGRSALDAAMLGVETAGHNIANAGTPGYSREIADVESANSLVVFTDHETYLGQGVNVRGQLRVDNPYLDAQFRGNNAQASYWQVQSTEIQNIAQIFNEPQGTTLRQAIDGFFNAWNELGQNPNDNGTRATVIAAAQNLVAAFHAAANQLINNQNRYENEIRDSLAEIQSIVQNIASLNVQIEKAQAQGDAPNDLLDQRDALLDKLSGYVSFTVTYTPDTSDPNVVHMSLTLNGSGNLTFNGSSYPLTILNDGVVNPPFDGSTVPDWKTASWSDIQTSIQALQAQNGSLVSLYDMYNYTGRQLTALDNLATNDPGGNSIAQLVNNLQMNGYDQSGALSGTPLFVGSGAAGIQVNINQGSKLAAASQAGASTDGSNAEAIAGLVSNVDSMYTGIITAIGDDGQTANQQNQTFSALNTQISNLRQSLSGVNINEEFTHLIQYQQTYNAAAQFISAFNQMLQTLIDEVHG